MSNEELQYVVPISNMSSSVNGFDDDIISKAKVHATELLKRQTSQIDKYNHLIPSNRGKIAPSDPMPENTQQTNVDNLLAKFRQSHSSPIKSTQNGKTYSSPPPKPVKSTPLSPINPNTQSRGVLTNHSNIELSSNPNSNPSYVQVHHNGSLQNLNSTYNSQKPTSDNLVSMLEQNDQSNGVQDFANSSTVSPNKKRKSPDYDDENHYRNVIRKVESLRDKLELADSQVEATNSDLYSLFNDLQGISADFGISFDTPELVVVGMQSDGKSSFIEGLLGFQFNIVDTNIGTRRPLIIQMINNPDQTSPYCRFRKEAITSGDEDPFEAHETTVEYLSSEIQRRTNEFVGSSKDQVSDKPIILRVEYKYCANLTIYDTPGFRLGGNEPLKSNIEEMVMKILAPKHRIVICLEQSTVEWANTVSRPIVAQVDPLFQRTVLVNTKFDNRVKELRDAEQSNSYLKGEGLPEGKRPFFISMPVRRNLDPQRFKDQMKESYLNDMRNLLMTDFDEKTFADQIGMFNLKGHLEKLLQERYIASLSPTLRMLESMVNTTRSELEAVLKELETTDISLQKIKAHMFVKAFSNLVEKLLQGSVVGNPDLYGQTIQEEKLSSGIRDWEIDQVGLDEIVDQHDIQNKDFKIYGGAQYDRLLNEFAFVAHSVEFPYTSVHEVASCLGMSKSHNVPSFEDAASDIVQIKARTVLMPLTSVVLRRCVYIMERLFTIAFSILSSKVPNKGSSLKPSREEDSYAIISEYEQFKTVLKNVYDSFVNSVAEECEHRILDDFETFTKIVDWDLLSGVKEISVDYNYLDPTVEETRNRVSRIMKDFPSLSEEVNMFSRSRIMNEESFQRVLMMAGKLFSGVRFFFVKHVRSKFNAFFLAPMFANLGAHLSNCFSELNHEQYEDIFQTGHDKLKEKAGLLEAQLERLIYNKNKFHEVLSKVQQIHKSK